MKTKILRILLGLCAIFAAHAQTITEDGQHKELAWLTEQTCYIALEPTNGTIKNIRYLLV
ncbi:MAG: hypothetical protein ACLTSL_13620 [Odoribacter splanchnicus]